MAQTFSTRSPQSPEHIVTTAPIATADDVREATRHARVAQRKWAKCAPDVRAAALGAAASALNAAADDVADLIVLEVGKPIGEARAEVGRGVSILKYYAQQVFDPIGATHNGPPGTLLFTARRPRGLAGLITPWNFPIAIPLWKLAPALAFGNAVLLKPAQPATACALRLAELLGAALPPELLHVLTGGTETGQQVAAAADVLSFTGSTQVGHEVVRSAVERGVAVQAEMGGQNPAIVLPDADIDTAATAIATAIAGYAGQKRTATKRVIVVGNARQFRDALVGALESLPIGDPASTEVVVGPLLNERARTSLLAATSSARDDGASY